MTRSTATGATPPHPTPPPQPPPSGPPRGRRSKGYFPGAPKRSFKKKGGGGACSLYLLSGLHLHAVSFSFAFWHQTYISIALFGRNNQYSVHKTLRHTCSLIDQHSINIPLIILLPRPSMVAKPSPSALSATMHPFILVGPSPSLLRSDCNNWGLGTKLELNQILICTLWRTVCCLPSLSCLLVFAVEPLKISTMVRLHVSCVQTFPSRGIIPAP